MKAVGSSQVVFVRTKLGIVSWVLVSLVLGMAITAWGTSNNWQIVDISTYRLFPLFGLIAFSTLWTQYVVLAIAQLARADFGQLAKFFKVAGFIVLVALLLHPSLLVYRLWQDGHGLPPHSYYNYVAQGLGWVTLLGTLSWLLFMSYNLKRVFGTRKWWKIIDYGCDLAMLAVYYHGLRLGGQLQEGWFHSVWIVYGIILVPTLIYLRWDEFRRIVKGRQKGAAK